jgi:hypothetical protein
MRSWSRDYSIKALLKLFFLCRFTGSILVCSGRGSEGRRVRFFDWARWWTVQGLSYLDRSTELLYLKGPHVLPVIVCQIPFFHTNPPLFSWFSLSTSQKPPRRGRSRHSPYTTPSHLSTALAWGTLSTGWREEKKVCKHKTRSYKINWLLCTRGKWWVTSYCS